jgi:hypothetical protein
MGGGKEAKRTAEWVVIAYSGGRRSSTAITYHVWVNVGKCLPRYQWRGRNVEATSAWTRFSARLDKVDKVVAKSMALDGSSTEKGGSANGAASNGAMLRAVSIVYRTFGFASSDTYLEPGAGVLSSAMYVHTAMNCLEEEGIRSERLDGVVEELRASKRTKRASSKYLHVHV